MSDLLNRFVRKLKVLVYRLRKESIVISNNTKNKIFLERRRGDFLAKKALRINPGMTITAVVSFYRGNIPVIRDIKKEIFEITTPVFQVCVDPGNGSKPYDCKKFS